MLATALSVCTRVREQRSLAARRQREVLAGALQDLGGTLTGAGANQRLPNLASCTFADRRGEDMLLALDLAGLAASSGSACASGSLDPSHVLLAMGLSLEAALGSLRLSTGYATTDEEISRAVAILRSVLTLPGVKTVGEASTGLNVRGGSADQNLVLMNGATVYNPAHFFGMFAIIGTVGLVDVRMLGVGKGIPIASLERFVPIGVLGLALNMITGFIFVAGNPVGGPKEYLGNMAFLIKMSLILVAGVNLLVFYVFGIARAANATAPDGSAPLSAKLVGAVSLLLWFGVIYFGRFIMYNDTLLNAWGL